MSRDVADAYDEAAGAWAEGAARVYSAVAIAVADLAPDPPGHRVVDIGAGTGVLGGALLARGAAQVVAVDVAPRMLAHIGSGISGVVGDARSLPFADDRFDLAATAFCFSHLSDPGAGVREARRTAAVLLSASFDDTWTHPAKGATDAVLQRAGYRRPSWYVAVKHAAAVDNGTALARLASGAGFSTVDVDRIEVDTGVGGVAELADWRLGMAHVATFTASLDSATRRRIRHDVEAALAGMPPLVVAVLVLTAS